MILSDGLVKEKMKYKLIQIEPEPTEESWQGMTLDGHLSDEVFKIKSKASGGVRIAIDLEDYDTKEFAKKYWEPIELTPEKSAKKGVLRALLVGQQPRVQLRGRL